ncbi:MAG: ABC transporter ATP-binding protein [Phycisphaerae bacterium]|nr:ABC transporter ATP-binding protein [Phycisphaerae bacterium]
MPRAQRKARARAALRRVGLGEELEECFPHELSGGMRQRVAIARALCPNPRIILMDEPFASLDEPMRHRLQEELLALWAQDPRTIVFVTHSIDEAVFLADRIVILAGGRKVRELAIELPRPRDRLAEEFARLLLDIRRSVAIRGLHA